jgi:DNA repair protein RecO (recombination protein O)
VPTYQTTGIVIGRTNFGEADRIIRLLTPEHGKLSAVAKGVRKIKSRLGGHLELFADAQLSLATSRNLDVITSARLRWYPHELTADYERVNLAYLFARLIDRTAQERTPQPELFSHLSEALRAVDSGGSGPLTELWFKLRLLNLIGYRPELGQCLVCGTKTSPGYAFDPPRGGLVCTNDASAASGPMSIEAVKLWRLLCDYSHATIARIAGAPALAAATLPLCDEFYEHHLGHTSRT